MTTAVTVVSTPTQVTLTPDTVQVNLLPTTVAVSLSNTGPQGPAGPQGPPGTASGFSWNEVTTSSCQMTAANGYIANNASPVTLTLPASAIIGGTIRVAGKGAGGWTVAQNAGQTIHFGTLNTTSGIAGTMSSQAVFDAVELLCITADSDWSVLSVQGNLTIT